MPSPPPGGWVGALPYGPLARTVGFFVVAAALVSLAGRHKAMRERMSGRVLEEALGSSIVTEDDGHGAGWSVNELVVNDREGRPTRVRAWWLVSTARPPRQAHAPRRTDDVQSLGPRGRRGAGASVSMPQEPNGGRDVAHRRTRVMPFPNETTR